MGERERLLTLLEIYDSAIEELYVLGDRGLVDFILRLERRRRDADRRLAELDRNDLRRVSGWVASDVYDARAHEARGSTDSPRAQA